MLGKLNCKMRLNNKIYEKDRSHFIWGLGLILLVYTVYYLAFADNSHMPSIPRKIRHLIKFGATILIYFIGTCHLGKLKVSWMAKKWHFVYISGL